MSVLRTRPQSSALESPVEEAAICSLDEQAPPSGLEVVRGTAARFLWHDFPLQTLSGIISWSDEEVRTVAHGVSVGDLRGSPCTA